jgi:hypothetical protein
VGDTQKHTHGQQRDLISLLYFFKIKNLAKKEFFNFVIELSKSHNIDLLLEDSDKGHG